MDIAAKIGDGFEEHFQLARRYTELPRRMCGGCGLGIAADASGQWLEWPVSQNMSQTAETENRWRVAFQFNPIGSVVSQCTSFVLDPKITKQAVRIG